MFGPRPSCSNKSLAETAVQDRPAPCSESYKTSTSGSAPAAARYLDALHLAAEHLAGPEVVANLDRSADRVLHGLPASRRGRLCVAICCCCPLPAPIRSLNCSALPQSGT
jgi:hypothetical protein